MENIILLLNNALEKQGISQTAIAEKLMIKQRTVNNLLAGRTKKPDMKIIHALAVELGVSVNANAVVSGVGMTAQAGQATATGTDGLPVDLSIFSRPLQHKIVAWMEELKDLSPEERDAWVMDALNRKKG